MAGSSKVLTVTYGTFSCTLEGFDDPVEAMKVVADYYREMAANDRHFGAEPVRADAHALERAADSIFAPEYTAHMEDDRLVLRSTATPTLDDPSAEVDDKLERLRNVINSTTTVPPYGFEDDEPILSNAIDDNPGQATSDDGAQLLEDDDKIETDASDDTDSAALDEKDPEKDPGVVPSLEQTEISQTQPTASDDASITQEADPSVEATDETVVAKAEEVLEAAAETATDAGEAAKETIQSLTNEAPKQEKAPPLVLSNPVDTPVSEGEQNAPLILGQPIATPASPPRARVVKMKRSEFEAAVAAGNVDQLLQAQTQAPAPVQSETQKLREGIAGIINKADLGDTEKEELIEDLVAYEERHKVVPEAEAEAPQQQTEMREVAPPPNTIAADEGDSIFADYGDEKTDTSGDNAFDQDVEIDRLVDLAEDQLEDEKSARRRDAYSRERAIREAVQSDETLRNAQQNDEQTVANYREDLATAQVATNMADATSRQSPLVLNDGVIPDDTAQDNAGLDTSDPEHPIKSYIATLDTGNDKDLLEAIVSYAHYREHKSTVSRSRIYALYDALEENAQQRKKDWAINMKALMSSGRISRSKSKEFYLTPDSNFFDNNA